ncbi:MAG: hypothetical protein QM518_03725 [Verrucomicrobiota bacterium]|nr:hypothetical protein [Verrucomicrobiota bacterium]
MNNHSDPQLQAFLDTATAGLGIDRELQLDVRAEIESHIQAAVEQESPDLPPDAQRANALHQFGPPEEIADQLVDANRKKMKTRARVRILFNAVIIPLALLVALASAWPILSHTGPARDFFALTSGFSDPDANPAGLLFLSANTSIRDILKLRKMSPIQRLIVYGDPGNEDRLAAPKAVWESDPDNRVYYAKYVLAALIQPRNPPNTEGADRLFEILEHAPLVDPDNALYDLIRAGVLLNNAASVEAETIKNEQDGESTQQHKLVIQDRDQLNTAMSHFLAALEHPQLRRYHGEMLEKQLAILGPPTSMIQQINQISIAASVLLPDLAMFRELGRVSSLYGAELLRESQTGELSPNSPSPENLLHAWHRFGRLTAEDAFCLIDVLVTNAVVGFGSQEEEKALRGAGRIEEAEAVREEAAQITRTVEEWRASLKTPQNDEWKKELELRAGVLDRMLLPAVGHPKPDFQMDYLRRGREMDFVLIEKTTVTLLIGVLTGMMLVAFLLSLRWRFSSGVTALPILLQPRPGHMAAILGATVLGPLVAILFLRHFTPLSGTDYSIVIAWPRIAIHLCLLIAASTIGLAVYLTKYVIGRFRVLDLPAPMAFGKPFQVFAAISIGYLIISSLLPDALLRNGTGNVLAGIAIGLTALWLVGGAIYSLAVGLAARPEYGLFHGSLCRTAIPIFALAILFMGLVAKPYLSTQERRLLAWDTAQQEMASTGGFTALETHITKHLRNGILAGYEGSPRSNSNR